MSLGEQPTAHQASFKINYQEAREMSADSLPLPVDIAPMAITARHVQCSSAEEAGTTGLAGLSARIHLSQ